MTKPPFQIQLIYGNQDFSVEKATEKWIDSVISEDLRELAYFKFDAEEMLMSGQAEVLNARIDDLTLAVETMPMLSERTVIRVHHVEKIRPGKSGGEALLKSLSNLRLFSLDLGGKKGWAKMEHLLNEEPPEEASGADRWIRSSSPETGGLLLVELAPDAPSVAYISHKDGEREIISYADFLKKEFKGKIKVKEPEPGQISHVPSKRLFQTLERVLSNLPPHCWVVLTGHATREKDIAAGLVQLIKKKKGRIEKFVTYDDYHPVEFLQTQAREKGLDLTKTAADKMILQSGTDLGRLAGEIEKLSLVFSPGTRVDIPEVEKTLHSAEQTNVFALNERLSEKDFFGSLAVLDHFFRESRGEVPALLGLMARHFRQLYRVHSLLRSGVPEKDMGPHLKLPPFIAQKVSRQARIFTVIELERMITSLVGMDVKIKRNARLTEMVLREFVRTVCRGDFKQSGLEKVLS